MTTLTSTPTPLKPLYPACAGLVLLLCAASAQAQYSYNTAGDEVTDARTRLVWKRCSQGQTWNGTTSTCDGTATTHTHEAALALGTAGWRLPNVKELESITDKSRTNPAIDPVAFPATPANWYWSATPYAGMPAVAWGVNFDNGYVYNGSGRSGTGHVRLVR